MKLSPKRSVAICVLTLAMLAAAVPTAHADRYDRTTDGHPLRLLAFILHPVGMAVEYVVVRPIHWVVSQPVLDVAFGHQPSLMEEGTYFEYVHGDFSPSVGRESARMDEGAVAGTTTRPY